MEFSITILCYSIMQHVSSIICVQTTEVYSRRYDDPPATYKENHGVSWFQPQQIGAGDRNIVSEYILLCQFYSKLFSTMGLLMESYTIHLASFARIFD